MNRCTFLCSVVSIVTVEVLRLLPTFDRGPLLHVQVLQHCTLLLKRQTLFVEISFSIIYQIIKLLKFVTYLFDRLQFDFFLGHGGGGPEYRKVNLQWSRNLSLHVFGQKTHAHIAENMLSQYRKTED